MVMRLKFAYRHLLIFLFLFGSVLSSRGQQTTILSSFDVFYRDGVVYLDWVISAGNTCNGTKIFRSTNGINFTEIGSIEGICGNPNSPQPFSFVDEDPVENLTNYYRLEMGATGFSEIESVEIIPLNNGYQVRPNPARDFVKIYFENSDLIEHTLYLYDVNGTFIRSYTTGNAYFDLNVLEFAAGLYLFTISDPDREIIVKGKLMVQ